MNTTHTATDKPALSPRARRALEILRAGGHFRKALESGYRGEKFRTRLYASDSRHSVVPGFGISTLLELERAGLLRRRPCPVSTTWPTEWVAVEADEAAAASNS